MALLASCTTSGPASPAAATLDQEAPASSISVDAPVESVPAAPGHVEAPTSVYLPWVVDVANVEAFHQISFKDVGLSVEDPAIYEILASGVAEELMTLEPLPFDATLDFDVALADPAHHLACGDAHIYVDVWRGHAPDRLGYSLWSGCEESAQFAWNEVPMSVETWQDPATTLTPLARAIAGSIGDAVQTNCFRRVC